MDPATLARHLRLAAAVMFAGACALQLLRFRRRTAAADSSASTTTRAGSSDLIPELALFLCGFEALVLIVCFLNRPETKFLWTFTTVAMVAVWAFGLSWARADVRPRTAAHPDAADHLAAYRHSSFPVLAAGTLGVLYLTAIFWAAVAVLYTYRDVDVKQAVAPIRLIAAAGLFTLVQALIAALSMFAGAAVVEYARAESSARRTDHWPVVGVFVSLVASVTLTAASAYWCYWLYVGSLGLQLRAAVNPWPPLLDWVDWPRCVLALGSAWCATLPWAVLAWPAIILGDNTPDAAPRRGLRRSRVWARVRDLPVSLIKSRQWLTTLFIDSHPTFVIFLGGSMLTALTPVMAWAGYSVPGNLSGYAGFSAWVGSTLSWSVLFGRAVLFFEDSCTRAYATTLYRSLQSLKGHLVILGYGHVGRRLLSGVIESGLLPYRTLTDHLDGSRSILMPDRRLGKLLTRVVIVDNDPARSRDSVRTPQGAAISVVEIPARRSGQVPCFVPLVVGDTGEGALTLAGFDNASFVACVLPPQPGADPAQIVMERLVTCARARKRIPPAVLATYSSDSAPHLTRSIIDYDLPVHYILPDHLEGLSAADVLHAAFTKAIALPEDDTNPRWYPRTLISGNGEHTFHLLDGFLKHLSFERAKRLCAAQRPAFVIVGTGSSSSVPTSTRDGRLEQWRASEFGGTHLRADEVRVSRVIARRPDPDLDGELFVPVVSEKSSDYHVWLAVLEKLWPDIIVFAESEPEEELRAIRSAVMAVNRLRDSGRKPLPMLVVSGEAGAQHVMRAFENDLVYYSSLWPAPDSELFPAPRMGTLSDDTFNGDFLVRVLDDPIDRILGLIRAYDPFGGAGATRKRPERIPVELAFCAPDAPGIIASTLASLGGLTVDPAEKKDRPTLGNSKVTMIGGGRFQWRSFAYLDHNALNGDSRFARLHTIGRGKGGGHRPLELVSTLLNPSSRQAHVDFIHDARRMRKMAKARQDMPADRPAIDDRFRQKERECLRAFENLRLVEQVKSCCGMPNCPVEAMHKIVSSSRRTVVDRGIRDDRRRWEHAEAIGEHFMVDGWEGGKHFATGDLPLASITCTGLDRPGGLACAMNALLFRSVSRQDRQPMWTFRPTYLSAYECHDERFAEFSCYGTLEPRREALCGTASLLDITIEPVRPHVRWTKYAESLVTYLNALSVEDKSAPRFSREMTDTAAGPRIRIVQEAR